MKEEGGYVAAIDPTVTPDLRREGMARELVSAVQRLRKSAGFAVSDRIRLHVWGTSGVEEMLSTYREYIAGEVLASEVMFGEPAGPTDATQTLDLDGEQIGIAVTRIE